MRSHAGAGAWRGFLNAVEPALDLVAKNESSSGAGDAAVYRPQRFDAMYERLGDLDAYAPVPATFRVYRRRRAGTPVRS
jgi:hypothetical protein